MTPEVQKQLADLREKLRARENRPGFQDNVTAIKAKIAELEAS